MPYPPSVPGTYLLPVVAWNVTLASNETLGAINRTAIAMRLASLTSTSSLPVTLADVSVTVDATTNPPALLFTIVPSAAVPAIVEFPAQVYQAAEAACSHIMDALSDLSATQLAESLGLPPAEMTARPAMTAQSFERSPPSPPPSPSVPPFSPPLPEAPPLPPISPSPSLPGSYILPIVTWNVTLAATGTKFDRRSFKAELAQLATTSGWPITTDDITVTLHAYGVDATNRRSLQMVDMLLVTTIFPSAAAADATTFPLAAFDNVKQACEEVVAVLHQYTKAELSTRLTGAHTVQVLDFGEPVVLTQGFDRSPPSPPPRGPPSPPPSQPFPSSPPPQSPRAPSNISEVAGIAASGSLANSAALAAGAAVGAVVVGLALIYYWRHRRRHGGKMRSSTADGDPARVPSSRLPSIGAVVMGKRWRRARLRTSTASKEAPPAAEGMPIATEGSVVAAAVGIVGAERSSSSSAFSSAFSNPYLPPEELPSTPSSPMESGPKTAGCPQLSRTGSLKSLGRALVRSPVQVAPRPRSPTRAAPQHWEAAGRGVRAIDALMRLPQHWEAAGRGVRAVDALMRLTPVLNENDNAEASSAEQPSSPSPEAVTTLAPAARAAEEAEAARLKAEEEAARAACVRVEAEEEARAAEEAEAARLKAEAAAAAVKVRMRACVHACMHASLHACKHASMHASIRPMWPG